MQSLFNDYNPANEDDIAFDADDLVGIALCSEDPLFQRAIHFKSMYDGVAYTEDVKIDVNSVEDLMADAIGAEDMIPEPNYEEIMPDDSDVSYDGIDAEEQIEAAKDILSGEADEEFDLIDLVDNLD